MNFIICWFLLLQMDYTIQLEKISDYQTKKPLPKDTPASEFLIGILTWRM